MKKLQASVSKWQNKTFGNNKEHLLGLTRHLKREVEELECLLYPVGSLSSYENIKSEVADCLIVLIGIADGLGLDLEKSVKEKMRENKKRKWKSPDKDGVIEHKK